MKHSFFIIVIAAMAALFTHKVSAGPISSAQALKNTQAFLQERGVTLPQKGMRRAPSSNSNNDGFAPYYVFNLDDNQGFVIASGDDLCYPVLAYSDAGSICLDSLPDNMRYWLGCYEAQIGALKNSKASAAGPKKAQGVAVKPLVTSKWDQNPPYNSACPVTPSGDLCATGCGPTAMAQVMYCHRKNSISYVMADIPNYDYNNRFAGVDHFWHVDGVPKGSPIDWDNMLDEYDTYYVNYTEEQKRAVANLMFYCGCSVQAVYWSGLTGTSSSLLDMPFALVTYFDYDDDVKVETRENYTDDEWETMVCGELAKGNPLIYAAEPVPSGTPHAFVVDGYDGKGYVHINWGWGGGSDGFFLLTATANGGEAMDGYAKDQEAVFGAVPNGAFPRLTTQSITLQSPAIVEGLSSSTSIPVTFAMKVANLTDANRTFEQAIGLYKNGAMQSVVKTLSNISNLAVKGSKTVNVSLNISSGIANGVYHIVPLSRASGASKWRKNGNYDKILTLIINGGKAKLVVGVPPVEGDIITFANSEAKRVCVDTWDTNGDGELSKAEAAAVKSLGTVFKDNKKMTSFDELAFFTGLETIEEFAFAYCSYLTSVTIPKNVVSIEGNAFYSNDLRRVTIPKSVKNIGHKAFCSNEKLEEIRVESGNPAYDSRDNCNAIIETGSGTLVAGCLSTVVPEGVKAIGDDAFHFCENLTSLTLPESVTSIGKNAFRYCSSLTTINLPKGITFIDECAFEGCRSLKSATLPKSLIEIGKSAFSETKLESVTIPASLKTIHENPFPSSLTSIIVDSKNPYFDSRDNCNGIMDKKTNTLVLGCATTVIPKSAVAIGDNAFYDCISLMSIGIPSNVKKIGDYAFYSCDGLSKVEIPEGVTELGYSAFVWCNHLTTVSLPSTIQKIGYRAFQSCPIRMVEVKMKNPVTLGYSSFASSGEATLYVPAGCAEKYRNATYWKDFKNIVEGSMPKRDLIDFADMYVKDICVENWDTDGDGELSKKEAAAVTDLGLVFRAEYLSSFDELQYFTGLTKIPDEAFYFCESMKSITLPPTLKSIGNSAFARCRSLEGIVVPEGVTTIGNKAFSMYDASGIPETTMVSVTLPSTLKSIGDGAFTDCNFKTINIPKSITNIGSSAFEHCENLTSVDIPQSMKVLNRYVFFGCKSLKTVTLHAGLQRFEFGAFYSCESLTAVNIPKSVTYIGEYAFKGCTNMATISLSETVDTICRNAFYGSGIKSLYIPKSVRSIGECITGNCDQLTSIQVDPANAVYDSRNKCNGIIETVTNELAVGIQNTVIPSTVTSISGYAYRDCKQLKSLSIPASISSIKQASNYESPFYGCDNLVSIKVNANNTVYDSRNNCNAIISKQNNHLLYGWQTTVIPKGVIGIDRFAFKDCLGLTSIAIPEGVKNIDWGAFENCENLVSASLPESLTTWGMGVFSHCHSLASIHLPSKISILPHDVFYECIALENVTIPENIKTIEYTAFQYCSGLRAVSIPSGVESIGERVFKECDNLTEVMVKRKTPPSIVSNTFSNYSYATLYVPKGCREAYRSADNWKRFGEIIEFTGIKGDLNHDGELSMSDVMLTVETILGSKRATFPLEIADMDGDGNISVSDTMIIVDIILHK